MANVLTSFIVGIGYDYDEKGQKQIESGIDGIKSKALQAGAVLAGAFGIKALTSDFANANDELGKFSKTFGIIPNDVAALGRSLQHEGGSLESFMSQIEGIERLRAGLLAGDASFIGRAGVAGIDPSVITNANSATEAYIKLGDQFAKMSSQQRLNAASALGLDEASIRLLSNGTDEVRKLVAAEQQLRPVTSQMTDEAARFNDETQDLSTNIGGIADKISVKLLPRISDVVAGMNDWIGVNRDFINMGIDDTLESLDKNIITLAGAGALLASGGLLAGLATMAKTVPLIGSGLAVAATAAARLSAVGAAIAVSVAGADIADEQLRAAFGSNYDEFDAKVTKGIFDLTGFDLSRGGVFEGTEREPFFDGSVTPGAIADQRSKSLFDSSRSPAQRETSGTPRPQSQRPIQVNLMLDGQVIDQRIIKVTDQINEQALEDITTSTGG
jgi:hypothetical protein